MEIDKQQFIFIQLNLLLSIREAKKKRDLDDIIGRLENILNVVNEIEFFDKVQTELFGNQEK